MVVHNLLFRVEKASVEEQKCSVIRTSPSIYTARLDEGRKGSIIFLSWTVLNFFNKLFLLKIYLDNGDLSHLIRLPEYPHISLAILCLFF